MLILTIIWGTLGVVLCLRLILDNRYVKEIKKLNVKHSALLNEHQTLMHETSEYLKMFLEIKNYSPPVFEELCLRERLEKLHKLRELI